jgi:hypothetical protein
LHVFFDFLKKRQSLGIHPGQTQDDGENKHGVYAESVLMAEIPAKRKSARNLTMSCASTLGIAYAKVGSTP